VPLIEPEEVIIARLGDLFRNSIESRLEVGIGDDAAVISGIDNKLVATVDMAVEGVHFRKDWSTPFQIGAKLTTASLADVFAMGGEPKYLLVAAAISNLDNSEVIIEVAKGIRSVADEFKVTVVGGDLSKSEKMVLSITALGDLSSKPIKRSGAKVGDLVYLSSLPGLSAAGMAILERELDRPRYVVEAHLNPKLKKPKNLMQVATAMSDISDGLSIDAGHIAKDSEVSINFLSELLRNASDFKDLQELATELDEDVFDWILNGGEDHFFIATVNPDMAKDDLGIKVGEVVSGDGKILLDGKEVKKSGYQHF
jgi:thiamine-monophosphate kinase